MTNSTSEIGLIVVDFDDTLYHNGISQNAIMAIYEARKNGKIVGVISGSGLDAILKKVPGNLIAKSLDFIGSSNGALIAESERKVLLVPEERVALLGSVKDDFLRYSQRGRVIDTGYSIGLLTQDKILIDEIECIVNENYKNTGIIPIKWNSGVSAVLITKYDALQKYCDLKGLQPVVMAIGDSDNDIPLFDFARNTRGKTCLVGNSTLETSVDYRSPFLFGEGVADCIRQYCIN